MIIIKEIKILSLSIRRNCRSTHNCVSRAFYHCHIIQYIHILFFSSSLLSHIYFVCFVNGDANHINTTHSKRKANFVHCDGIACIYADKLCVPFYGIMTTRMAMCLNDFYSKDEAERKKEEEEEERIISVFGQTMG